MKKFSFLSAFKALLLLSMMFIIGGIGVTSCDTGPFKTVPQIEKADSDTVVVCQQELGFANCVDIVQYHEDLVKAFNEDSVFRSMPTEVVTYVSAVLFKENKDDFITISNIVQCYLDNKAIFDAIQSANNDNLLQTKSIPKSVIDSLIDSVNLQQSSVAKSEQILLKENIPRSK